MVSWDLESPSFPFVPFCHVVPSAQWNQEIRVEPGNPGGPAGHIFSLDLQYLSGISCSNCLMISVLTSCIVMLTKVSFKTCLRFLGGVIVNCILDNGTTVVKKYHLEIIITNWLDLVVEHLKLR